jgi:hypothetical protein
MMDTEVLVILGKTNIKSLKIFKFKKQNAKMAQAQLVWFH